MYGSLGLWWQNNVQLKRKFSTQKIAATADQHTSHHSGQEAVLAPPLPAHRIARTYVCFDNK